MAKQLVGTLSKWCVGGVVVSAAALACSGGSPAVTGPDGLGSSGGTSSGASSGGSSGSSSGSGGVFLPPTAIDSGIGFGGGSGGSSGGQPVYNPVVSQAAPPPPISGGTLTLSADGNFAFAADSDRDALYIVDLTSNAVTTVALQTGDEPGRVIEDGAGHVHVVLRHAGMVASIDPKAGTVLERTAVCGRPRGLAYMTAGDSLYVACAGGELVTLPAAGGAVSRTVVVEPDLRDAVVVGSTLFVSELRSASILQIAADGTIANRFERPLSSFELGVAWRMIATPNGLATSLQAASTSPIGTAPGSYGTGGCGNAVTNPAIATWSLDGTAQNLAPLEGVLPVDLAVSPDGNSFAVVVPGEWLIPGSPQLVTWPGSVSPPPTDKITPLAPIVPVPPPDPSTDAGATTTLGVCGNTTSVTGQAIAVAFDTQGRVLVQSREPAQLTIDAAGTPTVISLSKVSRDDTGHEIFHSDQGGGIACASCHAEGGDDGRTWVFTDVGARRTPSVLGTVQGTAPYHWDGSQIDLPTLYAGSLARMNGGTLQSTQETAFTTWLDALPAPAVTPGDAAAIARGQALFTGSGACASCHSGPKMTNNQTVDVGTVGSFQVPPLVGVSVRAPFLHDGCASTLVEAIGACGHASTHGGSANFTSAQLSDLATYLGTL